MSPNLILMHGSADAAARSRREPGALVCQVDTRVLARNGATVQVPRGVFIFIAAVAAHPGAILSTGELTDLLYGDSPNGGPEGPGYTLSKTAIRSQPALAALGYRLELDKTHGRYARCCLSPHPVTYGDLAADLLPASELSHGQA